MSRRPDLRDVGALFVHQALIALGELPNPLTNQPTVELDAARAAIELLEVIEERTRAARNQDEEQFLLQSLTQLRLAYVRVRDAATTQSAPPSEERLT
ncbi:MAG: hypothetical protein KatS3mg039_0253 [Candidatus Kapaibacterium sp.]|nr:MAG: hypothetical protein KatS3mg039_0253 [Candidatus Kapabacteria bacterium]